jgi:hypothetical protein
MLARSTGARSGRVAGSRASAGMIAARCFGFGTVLARSVGLISTSLAARIARTAAA